MKKIYLLVASCLASLCMLGNGAVNLQAREVMALEDGSGSTLLPTQTPSAYIENYWTDVSRVKESGNYQYFILSEESKLITIVKFHNVKGVLNIPKTIDGYKVVGLGKTSRLPSELNIKEAGHLYEQLGEVSIFGDKEQISKVTIPSYIRFVGEGAFAECKNLKQVKLEKRSDKLYLKERAFDSCKSLDTLYLSDKVIDYDYEYSAFLWCGKIDKLIVEDKNTVVTEWDKKNQPFGKLYTVPNAKAIKWAKKCKLNYQTLKAGKIKVKKKGTKYSWNKVKATKRTYTYNKSKRKWISKKSKVSVKYIVLAKDNKEDQYQIVKTTSKRSIKVNRKFVTVKVRLY